MAYTTDTLASGGTAYFDGSFTVPTEVALPVIEYPFPDDPTAKQITRRYWLRVANYQTSSMTANSTDASFTLAYLTEERIVGQPGADLYEIERIYNEVPNSRDDYEGYVYGYPGINQQVVTTGDAVTLTGASFCTTTGTLSWSSPTFAPGTYVRALMVASVTANPQNGGTFSRQLGQTVNRLVSVTNSVGGFNSAQYRILNRTTGNFENVATASVQVASAATITASMPRRNPTQKVVGSRIQSDFFLVGTGSAICVASQIPLDQPFVVRNLYGGGETDVIAWDPPIYNNRSVTLPLRTTPSPQEYFALIQGGSELIADASVLERWRGNIYRRATRYVPAL